jgi:cyclophilin family peptidyl-prolyl cis-trans isomerase
MTKHRRALRLAAGLICTVAGCTDRPVDAPAPPLSASVEPPLPSTNKYDQPFNEAVTNEVGPDQQPPPDRTIAGKSTARLREAVERAWPTIRLAEAGRPLSWVVTLDTDLGPIEIALRPGLAPNHVRNFLALVQVGYYDGLRFDRIVHQEAEAPDGTRSEIRLVRFGCAAGTGDPGVGHLGYRLRSEFSDVKHEAGTVGFTRDADPSSAGVRVYITLAPAPVLDGSYTIVGRISKGMDVVEKIASGKLLPADDDPTRELPEKPVVISKATARLDP